jgi:hypothetical protein
MIEKLAALMICTRTLSATVVIESCLKINPGLSGVNSFNESLYCIYFVGFVFLNRETYIIL